MEKTKFDASIIDALDERALSNLTEMFSEESRRGLCGASARLMDARIGVFNKLRDLDSELDRRKPVPAESFTGESQRQVAIGLIVQLASNFRTAILSKKSVDQIVLEVGRVYKNFESRLVKVLEVAAVLDDEAPKGEGTIDVKGERCE